MWQSNADLHTALHVLLRDKAKPRLARQGRGHVRCSLSVKNRQNVQNTDELSEREDIGWLIKLVLQTFAEGVGRM